MKQLTIFKKASLMLTAFIAGVMFTTSVAAAIPYTGTNTPSSPNPAFNVYTGVPSVGTESDFFRSRVPTAASGDTSTPYVDPLNASCTAGQRIQMRVYVHNGANQAGNNNGSGPSVAHNTRVKVNLPTGQAASFNPNASITSSNAGSVSDNATINCNGRIVKLKYITGSASQYSIGSGAVALSDNIVSSGVPIRSHGVAGDVWGCWDERVYVLLSVQVEEAPPVPQVTAACDLFRITANSDRKVTVSQFKYTANNANFKSAVINWGDSSSSTVTDSNSVVGTTHQFNAVGTYKISTTVHFTSANGELQKTSVNCEQEVTFSPNKPPVIVTPTEEVTSTPIGSQGVTELVNTGPGSIAGIVTAVVIAGVIAFRIYLGRRLSRQ